MTKTIKREKKRILFSFFLSLIFSLFLHSCGENTDANILQDKNTLLIGNLPALRLGQEKILFAGTMPKGGYSRKNFRLQVRPPQEEESFSFFFFANKDLSGGLKISFHSFEEKTWMTFSLNGTKHSIPLEWQPDILDISVDVHNDHEDMHIVVWKGTGPFSSDEECVDNGSCLYNTERFTFPNEGPWGEQGKASGTYWGFTGDQKVILDLQGPNENLSNA